MMNYPSTLYDLRASSREPAPRLRLRISLIANPGQHADVPWGLYMGHSRWRGADSEFVYGRLVLSAEFPYLLAF